MLQSASNKFAENQDGKGKIFSLPHFHLKCDVRFFFSYSHLKIAECCSSKTSGRFCKKLPSNAFQIDMRYDINITAVTA
jgi:hypothetical protein